MSRSPREVARAAAWDSTSSLAGKCQKYAGLFWAEAQEQPAPGGYPDADSAYRASEIVSFDPQTAPAGAYHYFVYEPYGHVGAALGDGLMASGTSNHSGFVEDLGNGVLVSRVADYNRTYLGWSHTNGSRPRITAFDTSTAGGDLAPFDPQEVPDMDQIVLIQTPQKTGTLVDWWVQNLVNRTYYHVENNTQLGYLRALGVREVQGKQDPAVLAGFKRI